MNQKILEESIQAVYLKLINPGARIEELRALSLRLAELMALRSPAAVARMERGMGIYAGDGGP